MAVMNPDIKALWVAALRSGEYKQGRNYLHDPSTDTYCCLGVLCELAVEAGVATRRDLSRGTVYDSGAGGVSPTALPPGIFGWAGLESSNPYLAPSLDNGRPITAAEWNDSLGADFNKIANMIEEYL